jgi:hypothetical protein
MPVRVTDYRLHRYSRSTDPGFADALAVYVDSVPPSVRTNSNEITYWLDHYKQTYGDELLLFGLETLGNIVGYAELAYFREEQLLVVDYLAIDPRHRRNNVFYEFVDQILQHIRAEHLEFRFAVAEVAHYSQEAEPAGEGALLIRLLKLQGFKVARAPYYQPRIGLRRDESEMRATLLVYTDDPTQSLARETYLSIVRTLYFKHYLRWTSIHEGEFAAYTNYIETLFAKVDSALSKKGRIMLNGHKQILSRDKPDPVRQHVRMLSFVSLGLALVFVSLVLILFLRERFSLSVYSIIVLLLLSLLVFFSLLSVLSPSAKRVFNQLLRLFSRTARKAR